MSRKYKFYNKEGLYFVSFATVYWIGVFVRDEYFCVVLDRLWNYRSAIDYSGGKGLLKIELI